MSKARSAFFTAFAVSLWLPFSTNAIRAQDITATISLDPVSHVANVRGSTPDRQLQRHLSFLRSAIGFPDLPSRVSSVRLLGADGDPVAYRRFDAGDYAADADFSGWSYSIDLTPAKDQRASAHASWLGKTDGVLMLDDLLPRFPGKTPAVVRLELPDGWKANTTEKPNGVGTFSVPDIEKAVFVLGTETRLTRTAGPLSVATSGAWLFGDDEAAEMGDAIFREYSSAFGSAPSERMQIAILPFPQNAVQSGSWEAETRGNTTLIVSSDMPFKSQSLQRLHEQLRHEIFHLWLPNGVELTGRYDWFYEGFALYRSLKTGVAMNQIRFDDLLDTLSRAYNIDVVQRPRLPLVDASQTSGGTRVYARGMLVAFLCDLTLLENSKGKYSVDDVLRKLYTSHRPPRPPLDANAAIAGIFDSYQGVGTLIEKYVKGSDAIDWKPLLNAAGIETDARSPVANLRIQTKLNGRQKAILDKLGYNNWRKLVRKS